MHLSGSKQLSSGSPMNARLEMITIPMTKKNSFINLKSEIENSSTITSEQAMYKKLPAAKQAKISSIMSLSVLLRSMPKPTPIGVKIAKRQIMPVTKFLSSGKVLAIEIPRAIPAAPLCKTIAVANKRTSYDLSESPNANPSNIAWVPSPMSRINGVMFAIHPGFCITTF